MKTLDAIVSAAVKIAMDCGKEAGCKVVAAAFVLATETETVAQGGLIEEYGDVAQFDAEVMQPLLGEFESRVGALLRKGDTETTIVIPEGVPTEIVDAFRTVQALIDRTKDDEAHIALNRVRLHVVGMDQVAAIAAKAVAGKGVRS
jgi:hypothetical protein